MTATLTRGGHTSARPAVPPPGTQVARASTVFAVPVGLVHRNPRNPRSDLGDLTDLADSIREVGVLQPLLASRNQQGRITLIAGERRLEASKIAGLKAVPVVIASDMQPEKRLRMAVIENLHRAPMAPMDEARACEALLGDGLTRTQIAKGLGRSAAWVADRLALLELPESVQREVENDDLPVTKAVDLAKQVRRNRGGSVTTGLRCKSYFTKLHPLRTTAQSRCDAAGHPKAGRIGGVCGECWEAEIRADALTQAGLTDTARVA